MTSELFLGIVAGILTSIVIYLFTQFVNKILIPNVRTYLYQGPDISGRWNSYDSDEENAKPVGVADMSQKGEKITVNLNRHTSKSGRPINRQFEYQGRFVGGQLTLLGEDANMKGYIRSTMVFKLSSNSKNFYGKSLYVEHDTNTVIADDYWLKRGG